ncbi:endonuclease domain-containing protein [Haemophilus influenzae]|nr:endonuclease domain-containing protein [Haemophilus influenzae]MCK8840115.1 endonuclease domain-containing protein [Haemophilus influenzae]
MRNKNKRLAQYATELRRNMTDAEYALWYHLRNKLFCGIRFNRQVIIGHYIVDFCSRKLKLVIELDGIQHVEQEQYDLERTKFLTAQGYKVIRFWNDEVWGSDNICIRKKKKFGGKNWLEPLFVGLWRF